MIQLFRQNNFLTALLMFPYVFVVRMAVFYLNPPIDRMETAGVLYNVFLNAFENKSFLASIIVNLVIAFSAVLVNRVVIQHRLSRFQTLLPGLIYIFFSSWMEVFLAFNAIHIANFFVLIGLLSIFKFSKKSASSIVVFDGMFYFSMAALFYTPYIIYVFPALAGFIYLDRFGIREFLNALVGIGVPLFITSGLIYYFGGDFRIWEGYGLNKTIFKWFTGLRWLDLIAVGVYLLSLLICVFSYGSLIKKKNLIIQKKINVLYYFLITSFFVIFFISQRNPVHLLILCLPTSILVGMLVERSKAPALEEFFHLLILGAILFLHFNQSVNILI